jgi:hypothetical protein
MDAAVVAAETGHKAVVGQTLLTQTQRMKGTCNAVVARSSTGIGSKRRCRQEEVVSDAQKPSIDGQLPIVVLFYGDVC